MKDNWINQAKAWAVAHGYYLSSGAIKNAAGRMVASGWYSFSHLYAAQIAAESWKSMKE